MSHTHFEGKGRERSEKVYGLNTCLHLWMALNNKLNENIPIVLDIDRAPGL